MSEPLDLTIDLEKAFLPAWAQTSANEPSTKYAKYDGTEGAGRGDFRGPRGDRPPRRDGPRPDRGPRRNGPGPGPGPRGGDRGPRRDFGPRPGGGGGSEGLKWDPTQQQDRPHHRRDFRRDAPPEPLVPVIIELRPDPAGVASLARQIKVGGRAYPLLEVAGLVIQKPDRYEVTFRVMRGKDGQPLQRLFVCSLDDSVWLSEEDAWWQALRGHFDTFYQTEKQPCDPPKGVWTLVAMFDEIVLGPPNYHGYQERLREVHAQRAPRMPFDYFKNRVRIVKDESAVQQWVESQSFRLQYTTLNVPEPQTLMTLAEVETHFRSTHAANLVKETDSWVMKRTPHAPRLPEPLLRLMRVTLDRERRFPILTMTALSNAFAQAGLQFFKRDKTIVHVSVARPHYLDLETTAIQPALKQIIEFINAHPGTTRKKLIEALAPTPVPPAPVAVPAPAEPPSEAAAAEGTPAPAPPSEATPVPSGEPAASAATEPAPSGPTPQQQELLSNLHWLIHQGHVIEFANGPLETAKKPAPRPEPAPAAPKAPKQEKKDRPPRPRGRYVFDNAGLLPLPAAQPALVG